MHDGELAMCLACGSATGTQVLVLTIGNAILLKHCKHYKLITNFDQIRDHAPLEEYVKSFYYEKLKYINTKFVYNQKNLHEPNN